MKLIEIFYELEHHLCEEGIQVVSFTATSVHSQLELLWIVCRRTDMFFWNFVKM